MKNISGNNGEKWPVLPIARRLLFWCHPTGDCSRIKENSRPCQAARANGEIVSNNVAVVAYSTILTIKSIEDFENQSIEIFIYY
jgi:hypothetical protein